jgi:spore maturation protein B
MKTIQDLVQVLSTFVIVGVIVGFPLYGILKRVPVYEQFVEGAKEGFTLVVRIIRTSSASSSPWRCSAHRARWIFSSTACGLCSTSRHSAGDPAHGDHAPADQFRVDRHPLRHDQSYGLESLPVKMAAVIFGSSETTFYVIAVYFGSVNVTKVRHAVLAGLIAEGTAILASIYLVKFMYG